MLNKIRDRISGKKMFFFLNKIETIINMKENKRGLTVGTMLNYEVCINE